MPPTYGAASEDDGTAIVLDVDGHRQLGDHFLRLPGLVKAL